MYDGFGGRGSTADFVLRVGRTARGKAANGAPVETGARSNGRSNGTALVEPATPRAPGPATSGVPLDDVPLHLWVSSFEGVEGLSRLFEFRFEFASDLHDFDYEQMLGQPGWLGLEGASGTRSISGIFRSFERVGEGARLVHYAAELAPAHWILTRRTQSRIFQPHNCQDMSVPGIVQKVLADAGIPSDQVRLALVGSYEPRDYVVQYRESDFDFISRLMEDEGIYYYFEHGDDTHVMVLADSPASHKALAERDAFVFRHAASLAPREEHVYRVRDRRALCTGKVVLNDFDFTRVSADLFGRAQKASDTSKIVDFPGKHMTKELGQRYADIRLEEHQCRRQIVEMAASIRTLTPGYRMTLGEHPVDGLNRTYLIAEVRHRGAQGQSGQEEAGPQALTTYEAEVLALPAETQFRPPRATPRPTVRGSQTAIVVGPENEDIYVDEFGRVKVQFLWDPDRPFNEKSSCWVRVSQGWAGGGYGMMFLPRIGHEVIVDFLEGDPDRPIITGRVYNGDLSPIWDLPDKKHKSGIKSKSTPDGDGASALIFHDLVGEEYVHLHSQRDLEVSAEASRVDDTGGDLDVTVGGDRREAVKGYHELDVGSDCDEAVGGNKVVDIKGSHGLAVGGAMVCTTGSHFVVQAGDHLLIESSASVSLRCGGNFINIHPGGIDILGSVVNINSGGNVGAYNDGPPSADIAGAGGGKHVRHGYDVVYVPESSDATPAPLSLAQRGGMSQDPLRIASWIEIELVDEAGQPWPNEPYEITAPDGQVIRGALDSNGLARVNVANPGACRISFCNLDAAAWERL